MQVEARGHVQLHGHEPGLDLQHDGGRAVGQLLLLHDPLALQQQLQSNLFLRTQAGRAAALQVPAGAGQN